MSAWRSLARSNTRTADTSAVPAASISISVVPSFDRLFLLPNLAALTPADTPAAVHLVPDASLQRGDAVAECPDGHVDACLGTALARVRSALAAGGAA